mgnify:CR=1 FL=1
MSDNVTLSDILEAIKAKWDIYEFMDRFDISLDDVVNKFAHRVKLEMDDLAFELDLEREIVEDED